MPLQVPWFDNKSDPVLPPENKIKPFLYHYDEYQTYDILWYLPTAKNYYEPIYNTLRYQIPLMSSAWFDWYNFDDINRFPHVVNGSSEFCPLILFDRFTPWDYPWAEDYSTKIFNLIKKHCKNFFYSFQSVGYEPSIRANYHLPNYKIEIEHLHKLKFESGNKLKFICSVSESQSVVLTWIEFFPYSFGSETIKRYHILTLNKGENTINLYFKNYVCACSMVVSGSYEPHLIEAAIERADKGLLYKNLDKLISNIDNCFSYETQSAPVGVIADYPNGVQTVINYEKIPEWYYYANLTYANNNYWNNAINVSIDKDLGKLVFYTPIYNEQQQVINFNLNLWGNYTLNLAGRFPGRSLPLASGTVLIRKRFLDNWKLFQNNLYKVLGFLDPETLSDRNPYYTFFTEGEAAEIEASLESTLMAMNETLPIDIVILLMDSQKQLKLQENA